jgi:hypothetical protein
VTKFDDRYGRKCLSTGTTVILRSSKYKFKMRNDGNVLTCDNNAFYLHTLNIVEITL